MKTVQANAKLLLQGNNILYKKYNFTIAFASSKLGNERTLQQMLHIHHPQISVYRSHTDKMPGALDLSE